LIKEINIKLNTLHEKQRLILAEKKRFNVLKCGRRFGKTTLNQELAVDTLLDGERVGFWSPTYKDTHEVWNELKFTLHEIIRTKDEQVKQITTITGGILDMWSMEDPNSGRGRKYHRAIIDEAEKARHLKDAWELTIRATLVDYRGDAWFTSTPKFGDTYFKNTLFKQYETDPDWMSWRFTSFDNPHLDPEEVQQAQKLNDLAFRCEYLAEDVNIVDNPWAFAFDSAKHVAKEDIKADRNHPLYLSFDFNRNPICCTVIQYVDMTVKVIECVKLKNSNVYDLCNYILVNYPNHLYIVTGDATGKSSTALVRDNINYYTVIQKQLRIGMGALKVPTVNPSIEENQVLVNSWLQNAKTLISPNKANYLVYDLIHVNVSPDGKIDKRNRTDETQQADALDTFRYYLNTFHKTFLNLPK